MMPFGDWPAPQGRDGRLPYGLVSLWDMVNLHVSSLCALCSQLMLYQQIFREQPRLSDGPDDRITDAVKTDIRGWLKIARHTADSFEWRAVHDRIAIIEKRLDKGMTYRDVSTEVRVLRETIDAGLNWQLVYRYPQEKNDIVSNWQTHLASVLQNFPSARPDVFAAVDLWALGHFTASVFHFMRVLEHGLRALAKDVGISFEAQNWQNVIDQIESKVRSLGKTLPAGIEKSERLKFLSEACKKFVYFKDGWRNYVSHNRSVYDEFQARRAMEHVKSFMTALASHLKEENEESPPTDEAKPPDGGES